MFALVLPAVLSFVTSLTPTCSDVRSSFQTSGCCGADPEKNASCPNGCTLTDTANAKNAGSCEPPFGPSGSYQVDDRGVPLSFMAAHPNEVFHVQKWTYSEPLDRELIEQKLRTLIENGTKMGYRELHRYADRYNLYAEDNVTLFTVRRYDSYYDALAWRLYMTVVYTSPFHPGMDVRANATLQRIFNVSDKMLGWKDLQDASKLPGQDAAQKTSREVYYTPNPAVFQDYYDNSVHHSIFNREQYDVWMEYLQRFVLVLGGVILSNVNGANEKNAQGDTLSAAYDDFVRRLPTLTYPLTFSKYIKLMGRLYQTLGQNQVDKAYVLPGSSMLTLDDKLPTFPMLQHLEPVLRIPVYDTECIPFIEV